MLAKERHVKSEPLAVRECEGCYAHNSKMVAMTPMRSFFELCTLLRFPRTKRALSYISPPFLWYFGIFARSESVLAEQILWLLLAFAALAMHIRRLNSPKRLEQGDEMPQMPPYWGSRFDALAHLYLGLGALCVSQGIRRAYGGWASICLAVTPPPPLLWLVDLDAVRTTGLFLFTTIDMFAQSDGGDNLYRPFFVLFLYALRIYIQPKPYSGVQTWRSLAAALLLSKQIDDAKRWMAR